MPKKIKKLSVSMVSDELKRENFSRVCGMSVNVGGDKLAIFHALLEFIFMNTMQQK